MDKQATLYYVYDPMCSWCWGYQKTWSILEKKLSSQVDIVYCVGGLAPDSDLPMSDDMQQFLQQTWREIAKQLGTSFNFDFWVKCQPRRSTYSACRAVLVAREYQQEQAMLLAIQQAYYLQAKNPSDEQVLIELAGDIGLDKSLFKQKLFSKQIGQQLLLEITNTRAMPIQGFPSLVLNVNNQQIAIPIDYVNWQKSFQVIEAYLLKM
jgi:putative protein-disulfide isomerase